MLPIKPLKKILKQDCCYYIKNEAVWELKKFLEDIAQSISLEAVKEFEKLNKRREKLGLPRLKRLNAWAIKGACGKVLKQVADVEMGLHSSRVVSPGGDKMTTDKNATKPVKAADDAVEVA